MDDAVQRQKNEQNQYATLVPPRTALVEAPEGGLRGQGPVAREARIGDHAVNRRRALDPVAGKHAADQPRHTPVDGRRTHREAPLSGRGPVTRHRRAPLDCLSAGRESRVWRATRVERRRSRLGRRATQSGRPESTLS